MGARAASQLKDATYDERCAWMEDKKDKGNQEFKKNQYAEAIDIYTEALCGLDFGKNISNA
jgi:hypothetical protein